MSRRTKGHYPFLLKFNRRESFHNPSLTYNPQSRSVQFIFCSRQEFLCPVWKKTVICSAYYGEDKRMNNSCSYLSQKCVCDVRHQKNRHIMVIFWQKIRPIWWGAQIHFYWWGFWIGTSTGWVNWGGHVWWVLLNTSPIYWIVIKS